VIAARRLAGPLLALLAFPVAGAEIEQLLVEQRGERYGVRVRARLAAPPDAIWTLLTHYPSYPSISPAIQSCERIGADAAGGDLVLTRARACVIGFCKEVRQLQRVRQLGFGELLAEIQPAGSDFRSGRALWRLTPVGDAADLRFDAELEPKFWVPPLLGPWLIKRALEREARASVANLERLAQEEPPRP
jgi:hypothetical protein